MLQFIPATDELMDRSDLPGHWQLVPYQVGHPCFRWSLCEQAPAEIAATRRIAGSSAPAGTGRPSAPRDTLPDRP